MLPALSYQRRILTALLATTALCLSQSAYADTAVSTIDDTVVVAATRIATPLRQVASSVTVITAADIAEKQERTVVDVLNTVPGLNIVQTGGPGGPTSIFMRGTNPNHTKVLVDGIDVANPISINGAFDLGQFLAQDIERIEIIRGPQSGLYGSDAIGGVINIITKSGQGPAVFTGQVEGGSFETFNQAGGVKGSLDGFHYAAQLDHLHAGSTPVTPENLLAPGEKRNNDSGDVLSASAKLGYDFTDNFDLGLVTRFTNAHQKTTGDDFSTFPAFPATEQSALDTLEYFTRGTAHLMLDNFDQTLGVDFGSTKQSFSDPTFGNSYFLADRLKIDWQSNFKIAEGETIVLGAEHQRDTAHKPLSADTQNMAGFVELQSEFTDRFFNSASVRVDHHSTFGDRWTFHIAPAYLFPETGTKLKASFGTGFKAPTLSELFQDFPAFFFFANPNLKPELSVGWDAGFEQLLFDDRLGFGVTYYRNSIKNLITSNFSTYVNVGKAETDGIESYLTYKVSDDIGVRADYTFTEANDHATDLELTRRPKNKASFGVNWRATPELSINADLLYVGPWVDGNRDFSILRLRAPGYTTVDVAADYTLTEQFTLFGRINNLFDEDYQNPTGFLAPGRGFFAGIKATVD